MKKYKYREAQTVKILLIVCALLFLVTATLNILKIAGINKFVSFNVVADSIVAAVSLLLASFSVSALINCNYTISKKLKVVFGVTMFSIAFSDITRLIRATDDTLWLLYTKPSEKKSSKAETSGEEKDAKPVKERKLRIIIAQDEEADFISALRRERPDIVYSAEEK